MRLTIDNHQILFDAPRKMWKLLDERTSYRVEGFQFSPAFKSRVWDGKEHLAHHIKGTLYRGPVGLLGEVLSVARAMDLEYDVVDRRRHPEEGEFQSRWDHVNFEIRPYQEEAVEAIMKDRGLKTGKGLIDVATRGGKTVIILYAIHLLGVRSLILVQSERVMTQTIALARKVLKGVKIGVVGAGRWDPRAITIASVQTLTRNAKKPRCKELMTSVDFVNFDECVARGTMIRYGDDTAKRVEDVQAGDMIATPMGPRRVLRLLDQGVRDVIAVRTASGATLRCTPDHPIAMKVGNDVDWKEAQYAAADSPVHLFRVRDGRDEQEQRRPHEQLREPRGDGSQDAREQPNEGSGRSGPCHTKGPPDDEGRGDRTLRRSTMGEWLPDPDGTGSRSVPGRFGLSVEPGDRRWEGGVAPGYSEELPDRSGEPGGEDRCGDRRRKPCRKEASGGRRKEGRVPDESRMARHQDQTEEGDVRCLRIADAGVCVADRVTAVHDLIEPVRVYDLEVEEARCFFANDLLVHNCHHLKGKSWRAILDQCDAFYKIGTSATIFLHRKRATPMGSIVIRGVTGPVLFQISPSELIRQGYLVPPKIELVSIQGPPARGGSWDEVYDRGVVHHNVRNAAIARKAREYHDRGLTVLVNVRLLEHVEVLEDALKEAGLSVAVIIGSTPKMERDRKVAAFVRRNVDVILGTIFKEGVDIPAIEGVVNAAGGKSKIAAVQQFRNLTPSDGKSHAVLADFMDMHNPTLAKHSLERLKVYRSHEMFEVGTE